MKVTTDACTFGAWVAEKSKGRIRNILDIGTGTGLLMLMLAQKTKAEITGIEIDCAAAEQAKENCAASSWSTRLEVFNADVRKFEFRNSYDLIISNPPFHKNQLVSPDEKKNLAHHSSGLELNELITVASSFLQPLGHIAVLIPFYRNNEMIETATARGFYVREKLLMKQSPTHDFFRSVIIFSRIKNPDPEVSIITISDSEGNYTAEFIELLKDYYFNL